MMKWHRLFTWGLGTALMATAATAQPARDAQPGQAAAAVDGYPAGVSVGKAKSGRVYVDRRGMTLYTLDPRDARGRAGTVLDYCIGPCADIWSPLEAPADAKPIGLWKVGKAAQGPQWTYKGSPVFTFKADKAPGATGGDGYDDLWSAIPYVPPVPKLVAPASVAAIFVDGDYVMADGQQHILYTADSAQKCGADCGDRVAFAAAMASRNIGAWTVSRDGDRPQWACRGKLVFVSQDGPASAVPAGGRALVIVPQQR